ncbi:Rossmann-fold NAD(P)-binding domain-containing protein [Aquibacillus rhizosphaerae]|uniref:Uncharacterized protein n=1 Tax=Aquibacillus rhizosphaerae TaxID=3051431 RepID=A0ABT7LAM9_9BACI|nr:hypothetical protein [Aquibacillus sp. LR5S19]MDL4842913.1 hypothetical protein [Aquibacillus sp. LR5S19]
MYLVLGCYHWIGFHITNKLLKEGYHVIGFDEGDAEKEDELSMFFGRNSLFTKLDNKEDIVKGYKSKKFNACFNLLDQKSVEGLLRMKVGRWFQLGTPNKLNLNNKIVIDLPLLFGEWMPRKKSGFIYGKDFIYFNSGDFKRKALYIEDFVDAIFQLVQSSHIPSHIQLKPFKENNQGHQGERIEYQTIFVREGEHVDQRLEKIKTHYEQFHSFYDS